MSDQLKLSEAGNILSQDPSTREYLQCYGLPSSAGIRYGTIKMDSPEPLYRVGLFGQAWLPQQAEANVLFIHGFSEHTGNYGKLINDLVKAQLGVMSLDLRGHGFSEGPRGHSDTPNCYLEDLEYFAQVAFPSMAPHKPLHVWAHSLGALLAIHLILRKKLPIQPSSVVLSSPFLGFPEVRGSQKILAKLAPIIARFMPAIPVTIDMPPETLSQDESYLREREQDPLMFRAITPLWLLNSRKLVTSAQEKAAEFGQLVPTLFMLAGDERVTNLSDARRFAFNGLSEMRHKIIEFPGYRHELEKEPLIRSRVVKESIAWILSHSSRD